MADWEIRTYTRYCIFRDGVKFCETDNAEDAALILKDVKQSNGVQNDRKTEDA